MICVLAGGVGAAKFLRGLVQVVDPSEITVVANTGDDTRLFGLHVAPDLDTLTYNLGGVSNAEFGWGLAGDTFHAIDALARFGAPTWFRLGDRDLATNLYRSERLGDGATLSEVTKEIATAFGVALRLLPMTDDTVATRVELEDGEVVEFQEYFVHRRHEVAIRAVHFAGVDTAKPAPGVLEALHDAALVVVAPSNPIVSIGPILAVSGVAETLAARRSSVVAISPIVAGAALKGPAARMLVELGHEPSALGVARLLAPSIGAFVLDERDGDDLARVHELGIAACATETVMADDAVAAALARVVLHFATEAASA